MATSRVASGRVGLELELRPVAPRHDHLLRVSPAPKQQPGADDRKDDRGQRSHAPSPRTRASAVRRSYATSPSGGLGDRGRDRRPLAVGDRDERAALRVDVDALHARAALADRRGRREELGAVCGERRGALVSGRSGRLDGALGADDHGLDHLGRDPDELRKCDGSVHAGARS